MSAIVLNYLETYLDDIVIGHLLKSGQWRGKMIGLNSSGSQKNCLCKT